MLDKSSESLERFIFELSDRKLSKSERTRIALIENAIDCISDLGIERATLGEIAKRANVSRPLVVHYFKKKENVFSTCIDFIDKNSQDYLEKMINHLPLYKDRIETYINANFQWARVYPNHCKLWFYVIYQASFDEDFREINSNSMNIGRRRIKKLLQNGVKAKEFSINHLERNADLIHMAIYQGLVVCITERSHINLFKKYSKITLELFNMLIK